MNARTQTFDFTAECHQVSDVVSCIFHSILFHRTLGKFHYRQEGKYSIGTIGYEDVDCDFVDLTYVRCASTSLAQTMSQHVMEFDQAIRDPNNITENGLRSGQISLEFYNKKKVNWPFTPECLPWEVWTVRIEVKTIRNEIERRMNREFLGELVGEKVVLIAEVMNRQQYLPKIPAQSEVDLIFDTSYPDIQPYLFRTKDETLSDKSPLRFKIQWTIPCIRYHTQQLHHLRPRPLVKLYVAFFEKPWHFDHLNCIDLPGYFFYSCANIITAESPFF